MTLLSSLISSRLQGGDNVITVRTEVKGDGNYKVIVGYEVDSLEDLPDHLPEYTETLTVPACRYAKVLINEGQQEGRLGYGERMHADEYFVGISAMIPAMYIILRAAGSIHMTARERF